MQKRLALIFIFIDVLSFSLILPLLPYFRRPAVGCERGGPTRRRTDHRAALRPLRPGLHRLPDRLVALCPETAGARRPGHQLRVHVRGAADRRHPGRWHRAT
jgi:hypothetical protein